ncbi:uncharacterized protein LOC132183377 [Corylus avellana]|uniref:uncharacterized protein LOC132183377 n=1 Tax=Corylus avellana TaxID=13451 RepID=UPI001E22D05E|nr:uncharacterized protein LOC132183377 [Corylus avellana]
MEESFKVRVDKIFGSLASSSSSSETTETTPSSSLWSLTDEEIERRQWVRDKTIPESELELVFGNQGKGAEKEISPVDLRDELEKDLEDLDEDDVEEEEDNDDEPRRRQSNKPDDYDEEQWDIKSGIGQDCTLDYEEEEDGYDKLAVGREKPGERLYLRDIADYGIDVDSCNELPVSFEEVIRDPRANHLAAKIRLEEDAEAAKSIDSLRVSEKDSPDGEHTQMKTSEHVAKPKSILKRKDVPLDSKSEKRVRFEPECKDDCDEGSEVNQDHNTMDTSSVEKAAVSNEANFSTGDYSSAVPDYIRNPSKYTHYSFDSSSDMDEQSNKEAYMDFLKLMKRSNSMESQGDDFSNDLPSVTFIPKRRAGDTIMEENTTVSKQSQDDGGKEFMHRRGPIAIADRGTEETEVCAMEEDVTEPVADGRNSSQRVSRKYRTKSRVELDESNV